MKRLTGLRPFLLATVLFAPTPGAHAQALNSGPPESLTSRFIALAIQGELPGAQALLEQNAAQAPALYEQFVSRFVENAHEPSPASGVEMADRVITAYRAYWSDSLMKRKESGDAEAILAGAIHTALGPAAQAVDSADKSAIYRMMEMTLAESGLHVLQSPAPPLRDLYLWREQSTRSYDVRLTDRTLRLDVVFMDDLISLGWKEYASLGLATTTGWVEQGRLYCVSWAYDRDSENFRVSYLKHEARHLVDLELYPDMDTTELEYRAKLTELAFAHTTTQRILNDFTDKAANNRESSHAMANLRVVDDINHALGGADHPGGKNTWSQYTAAQINRAARSLLDANTRKRKSR